MRTLFKLSFILALIFGLPSTAQAQESFKISWDAWDSFGILTDCSATALNASNTCGGTQGFRTEGYDWISFTVDFVYDAGTSWEFFLEACNQGHETADCDTAADWYRIPAQKTIINTGTEYGTNKIFQTVAADSKQIIVIPIKYKRMRVVGFQAGGSPTASDLGTISAIVFNY